MKTRGWGKTGTGNVGIKPAQEHGWEQGKMLKIKPGWGGYDLSQSPEAIKIQLINCIKLAGIAYDES